MATLSTVISNGPSANRVDIVVLGDGYTQANLNAGTLVSHVASLTGYLFESGGLLTDPFARYAEFFNVHIVATVSNQSGADRPQESVVGGPVSFRDTALGATYWGDGVTQRLLVVNHTVTTNVLNAALQGTGITADMKFVAVNDALYGGSGGTYGVFAGGSSSALELALHEIGHSFAGLADHYSYGPTAYEGFEPFQPDITTDPAGTKWARWLGYDQPGVGVIGAYEGGHYNDFGIWRPSLNSKMMLLGQPFDAVGREQFILDFYALVDPLDGHSANAGTLRNTNLFSVDSIDPAVIKVNWTVDGVQDHFYSAAGEQFSLSGHGINGGDFTIRAFAYDDTGWVRVADRSSLQETVTWTVINDGSRTGGAGNDVLFVGSGNDTLTGNAGNDTLNGGAGADTMAGGPGNDTYMVNSMLDVVTEASSAGTDLVQSTAVGHVLRANVENLTLTGTANINGTGNTGNNVLTGNTGSNILTGNSGNDTLNGGTGADTMAGGLGNDIYMVNSVLDVVTEASSAGTDLVQSTAVAHTLSVNVENLTLTGTAAINGTGNAGNNVLTGNSGNNVLNGGAGNDTLSGGAGSDSYLFASALGANNIDQVTGYSVADDTIRLENAIFTSLIAPGALAAASFRAGAGFTAAADANDYIIYNTTTGQLFYDAGGNTGAASVHFATLTGHPALAINEFGVI